MVAEAEEALDRAERKHKSPGEVRRTGAAKEERLIGCAAEITSSFPALHHGVARAR
jgi:hypothetical protein